MLTGRSLIDSKCRHFNKEEEWIPVSVENKALIIRVAEIVITELKLQDITPDTFDPDLDLVDELGVDSMDLATVVLVLQDEYGNHH